MDRNLGAMNTNNPNGGVGSVYYQFGRKDPFASGTLYKPEGTTTSISNIAWNSDVITTKSSEKGKNVPYSIQNPLKFITSSSTWTTGDQYCPVDGGNFIWQDPKAAPSADGKVKKSIFDPCPSGWMVPVKGTWEGFTYGNCPYEKTRENGNGRYNYPDKATHPDDYFFYSASGYLRETDRSLQSLNERVYYLSCSPAGSYKYSFYFRTTDNSFNTNHPDSPRAQGNMVRCIQEYF